ncbi:MAG: orotidine-5'-phosphate decarboxylase [Microbacter sp.]
MTANQLFEQIKQKKSFLCVGLDTDSEKIPSPLQALQNQIFEFNKAIIDATADLCVAYKPNIAFYERLGIKGWEALSETVAYLRHHYPNHFLIADAKRGDIGNTSRMYAKTFFEQYDFDAVTVAPYMGEDSVTPFLTMPEKWAIVLALTSNPGSVDFQMIREASGEILFEKVLEHAKRWGNSDQMMFVVGATQADYFSVVRQHVPSYFLLVPGVGAQGGDLRSIAKVGLNDQCGLLVNSSRQILYASSGADFRDAARHEAQQIQKMMQQLLEERQLIDKQ